MDNGLCQFIRMIEHEVMPALREHDQLLVCRKRVDFLGIHVVRASESNVPDAHFIHGTRRDRTDCEPGTREETGRVRRRDFADRIIEALIVPVSGRWGRYKPT